MNKLIILNFLLLNVFFHAQNKGEIEVDLTRGQILLHKKHVAHLITGHPQGFFVNYNFKADGSKEWHHAYNYPDWGLNFHYLNLGNEHLGNVLALGAHYNFYFLNRHLVLKIGQGIGFTTNPYDKDTNYKNVAFGSRLMSNNLYALTFKKQNIIDKIGFQAGFSLSHFSNARLKAPNSGINNFLFHVGLNYNFDKIEINKAVRDSLNAIDYKENIKLNAVFRTGVSSGIYPGMQSRPFYHIGFFADKRIGRKSVLQLGSDVFFSHYIKDMVAYNAVAFPERPFYDANVDYKRIGLFIGPELLINKFAIEKQIGFYVYDPSKIEVLTYQRFALKYYLNKHFFIAAGLKTHMAKAEAPEIGIGYRF
jgi:hypothetical protein